MHKFLSILCFKIKFSVYSIFYITMAHRIKNGSQIQNMKSNILNESKVTVLNIMTSLHTYFRTLSDYKLGNYLCWLKYVNRSSRFMNFFSKKLYNFGEIQKRKSKQESSISSNFGK